MPNDPPSQRSGEGETPTSLLGDPKLTATQRQILQALCRPCRGENRYATPATNQQIAGEVFLSVDAVKAHLRALYRKFGVEPLPHNQKRARLVELVLESGILGPDAVGDGAARAATAVEPEAPPPTAISRPAEPTSRLRPSRRLLIGAGLAGGAALLVALLAGAFTGDEEAPVRGQPSKAEYVEAVNGACANTATQVPSLTGGTLEDATTAERAAVYLTLIDAFTNRVEDIPLPAGDNRDLNRFHSGLRRAADLTNEVAAAPARLDAPQRIRLYADLTYATGQVQAGVIGYGLGEDCLLLGRLVARSAANVSGAP
jgi:hypothetical protein